MERLSKKSHFKENIYKQTKQVFLFIARFIAFKSTFKVTGSQGMCLIPIWRSEQALSKAAWAVTGTTINGSLIPFEKAKFLAAKHAKIIDSVPPVVTFEKIFLRISWKNIFWNFF